MDNRERNRIGHPPACTCVICNNKRLAGLSRDSRVKGCPVCNGLANFRFHHGQYWDIYVDYDGRIRVPIRNVALLKRDRFRCTGCYGIVRKDEIDDPILKSVEDEVLTYWANRRNTENVPSGHGVLSNGERKEKVDNARGIEADKVQEAGAKQGQVNQASRDQILDEWTRKYHTKVSFWQKLKSLLYEGPSH